MIVFLSIVGWILAGITTFVIVNYVGIHYFKDYNLLYSYNWNGTCEGRSYFWFVVMLFWPLVIAVVVLRFVFGLFDKLLFKMGEPK